jgi:hypothetical protein
LLWLKNYGAPAARPMPQRSALIRRKKILVLYTGMSRRQPILRAPGASKQTRL